MASERSCALTAPALLRLGRAGRSLQHRAWAFSLLRPCVDQPRPPQGPSPAPNRPVATASPAWASACYEFQKHSECEDPFDYVGSSSLWTRSSSKRDLRTENVRNCFNTYRGEIRSESPNTGKASGVLPCLVSL